MKIVFDNSIHLGQFCLNNEAARIAAKNSQVLVSQKNDDEYIGVESFNENTFSDDIIWSLAREPQDVFYRFMDVYHSVKNVLRVPLTAVDATFALEIAQALNINFSNALTCALAIRMEAKEVHSLYIDFANPAVQDYLLARGVKVALPNTKTELVFANDNLEEYYQTALASFKKHGIELTNFFHS